MTPSTGQAMLRVLARLSVPGYTVADMEQPGELVGRALVVVVDDRTAHGEGSTTAHWSPSCLARRGSSSTVSWWCPPTRWRSAMRSTRRSSAGRPGGVGGRHRRHPRCHAEATRDLLDRELLGIAEALRASALSAGIVDAGVSRGLAGISGSTLVVNLAGSRCGARQHGHAEPAGCPDHRPAIQLGDLTSASAGAVHASARVGYAK